MRLRKVHRLMRGPLGITETLRRQDRIRAAIAIGRPLLKTQPVHHHSLTQIVICESDSYHKFLHVRTAALKAGLGVNTPAIEWPQTDDSSVLSVRVRKAIRWHLNRAAKAAGQKQADYLRGVIERAVKPSTPMAPPIAEESQ